MGRDKGEMNVACAVCGIKLHRNPAKIAQNKHHYCGLEHMGQHKAMLLAERAQRNFEHTHCAYCGKEIDHTNVCKNGKKYNLRKKFCDRRCSALFARSDAKSREKWSRSRERGIVALRNVVRADALAVARMEARSAAESYVPANDFAIPQEAFD